jgi:hypothetical protein
MPDELMARLVLNLRQQARAKNHVSLQWVNYCPNFELSVEISCNYPMFKAAPCQNLDSKLT